MSMRQDLRFNFTFFVSTLAITAGIILALYPPSRLSPEESKAAALGVITIGFWATGAIPQHLTALLFFLLAMLFSVAPANVIFSGFGSTALWLIFGGLVIGVAITSTGLGKTVADRLAVHLDGSYFRIISGVVTIGVLFAFLMPSAMGRVVLLIPIIGELATHFGFERGSNGRTGIFLAGILGSFVPAFAILPANVPNMVLVGLSETLFHMSPLYGEYLLLHFPVLGVLRAAVIVALILWLYPDKPREANNEALTPARAMSKDARLLSVVLLVLLALWITDFIHHVSPAWVALAGAVFLLLPKINLVNKKQFNEKINYGSLFFVAGILGLGAMVSHSGLGDTLAKGLIGLLPFGEGSPFWDYMSLSLASLLTGVATTAPGVPAVITPLSDTLSQVTSLPLKTVLMTQVLGFSTVIFPYQAPPIAIGMQLAGEKLFAAFRVCFLLAIISIFFLLPLNYFWWKVLGWV
ncbi:MAG: SLC13 family permease [Thermodesulfobacteriota bacterium]|nr:SLC13 family permease [Thermodesulfobacteriota bacterium]